MSRKEAKTNVDVNESFVEALFNDTAKPSGKKKVNKKKSVSVEPKDTKEESKKGVPNVKVFRLPSSSFGAFEQAFRANKDGVSLSDLVAKKKLTVTQSHDDDILPVIDEPERDLINEQVDEAAKFVTRWNIEFNSEVVQLDYRSKLVIQEPPFKQDDSPGIDPVDDRWTPTPFIDFLLYFIPWIEVATLIEFPTQESPLAAHDRYFAVMEYSAKLLHDPTYTIHVNPEAFFGYYKTFPASSYYAYIGDSVTFAEAQFKILQQDKMYISSVNPNVTKWATETSKYDPDDPDVEDKVPRILDYEQWAYQTSLGIDNQYGMNEVPQAKLIYTNKKTVEYQMYCTYYRYQELAFGGSSVYVPADSRSVGSGSDWVQNLETLAGTKLPPEGLLSRTPTEWWDMQMYIPIKTLVPREPKHTRQYELEEGQTIKVDLTFGGQEAPLICPLDAMVVYHRKEYSTVFQRRGINGDVNGAPADIFDPQRNWVAVKHGDSNEHIEHEFKIVTVDVPFDTSMKLWGLEKTNPFHIEVDKVVDVDPVEGEGTTIERHMKDGKYRYMKARNGPGAMVAGRPKLQKTKFRLLSSKGRKSVKPHNTYEVHCKPIKIGLKNLTQVKKGFGTVKFLSEWLEGVYIHIMNLIKKIVLDKDLSSHDVNYLKKLVHQYNERTEMLADKGTSCESILHKFEHVIKTKNGIDKFMKCAHHEIKTKNTVKRVAETMHISEYKHDLKFKKARVGDTDVVIAEPGHHTRRLVLGDDHVAATTSGENLRTFRYNRDTDEYEPLQEDHDEASEESHDQPMSAAVNLPLPTTLHD